MSSVSGFTPVRFTPSRLGAIILPTARPQSTPATLPADTLHLNPGYAKVSVVSGKDTLSVKVVKGTTLYGLASLYATDYMGDNNLALSGEGKKNIAMGKTDPDDAQTFVRTVSRVNLLTNPSKIQVGRVLKLPTAGNPTLFNPAQDSLNLTLAIAVQKSATARRKAGHALPELDFTNVKVESGPLDSYKVSVKKATASDFVTFYVADDLSGEHPDQYTVNLPSELPRGLFPGADPTPGHAPAAGPGRTYRPTAPADPFLN